jgi:hypothetical protein
LKSSDLPYIVTSGYKEEEQEMFLYTQTERKELSSEPLNASLTRTQSVPGKL